MGFIKAAMNAVGSTFADQYKEVFVCPSIGDEVLMVKGQRQRGAGDTNKATDDVISDGSVVIVNKGQCLIVVDNGAVIDFCAEPGQYIYQTGTSPSMLTGGFTGLKDSFKTVWERIQTGGQRSVYQRVYYVNMKEIIDNKYGVGNVPYRDNEFNMTITIKCFGRYSYKITNPFAFYSNIAANVDFAYKKAQLDEQLKAEVQSALQPALARISQKGYSYDVLPLHNLEVTEEMQNALTVKWSETRGLSIASFAIESVQPDEDSRKRIQDFQSHRVFGSNDAVKSGLMVSAHASALEKAADNSGGALTGFLGLGAVQNVTGSQGALTGLLGQAHQSQQTYNPGAQSGAVGAGMAQQMQQPQQATGNATAGWNCECGKSNNQGKFCDECGMKKPEANGWQCACGAVNKGKFCAECGAKKPVNEPLYVCDKCGWEPEDPKNPPKFCPECGDKFDDSDIK